MSLIDANSAQFFNFYNRMDEQEKKMTKYALNQVYRQGYQQAKKDLLKNIKKSTAPKYKFNLDDDDDDDDY